MNILIFRRDLRLFDNTAFIEACKAGGPIIPIFIFNPNQIDPSLNRYYNEKAARFLLEALQDLRQHIIEYGGDLLYFENESDTAVLTEIKISCLDRDLTIKGVFFNRDVTPFAHRRDDLIEKFCQSNQIRCDFIEDYTNFRVGTFKTATKSHYQVFTPFYNATQKFKVPVPVSIPSAVLFADLEIKSVSQISSIDHYAPGHSDDVIHFGCRASALRILANIKRGDFKSYAFERNSCAKSKTTEISVYLKFGLVSTREMLHSIAPENDKLIRQLFWRDYYYQLYNYTPRLLKGQISEERNEGGKKGMEAKGYREAEGPDWDAWCFGKTGSPFCDAAMRSMVSTGTMHNRARMYIAMYLKSLNFDWRDGERFLATQLLDYDPCANSGGWQWSSSSPKSFDSVAQLKRLDPQCVYVKRWIPELRDIDNKDIFAWLDSHIKHPGVYCKPIKIVPKTGSRTIDSFFKPDDSKI